MKNMRKFIEKLKHPDPSVRRMSAEALSEGDERAIYPLIKALHDDNPGVQDAAMRALINIGTEEVAYMTIPLLRENALLRNTALIIITAIGAKAVPLLYTLLRDKDDDMRKFAIDLFADIKETVDAERLLPFLKDVNPNVRAATAKALGKLGYVQAIPHLIQALNDEEWVCFSVLEALGDLNALESVPQICKLLEHESEALVYAAVETLGRLGSEDAIGPLMGCIDKVSDDIKVAIVKSLVQIGLPPNLKDICRHLIKMFKESDWEDKEIALKGIADANCKEAVQMLLDTGGFLDPSLPENEDKIPLIKNTLLVLKPEEELIKSLDNPEIKFRGKALAIDILGEIKSKNAIPKLISYLEDMRRDLRRASVGALAHIAEPEVIEPLLEVSRRDADSHVRKAAVNALGMMQAKEAFVPLIEMLEHEQYYDIVECMVLSLIKIDQESFLSDVSAYSRNIRHAIAKNVRNVDALKTLINDPDKQVKILAIMTLGKLKDNESLGILLNFLKDPDPEIRKSALVGIAEMECCCEEIYDALNDSDDWVRFYALQTILLSCGENMDFELIKKMLNDPFVPVVMTVIDYLKGIGGQAVSYTHLT
ncbi:MAG: HEAT repeat domain-containing protein, partial [Thermodesulfovibrionales bacterium]|nr:HEAT repeat domain-containing protein [Thermodesulfovibrionales bacterium]